MPDTYPSRGRTIRYQTAEANVPGDAPAPAVLLLHGAGGNSDLPFRRIAPALAELGIRTFAVSYFDRTGTTFAGPATLTDGFHVPLWLDTIRDGLHYFATQPQVDPRRIALLGISLGAFLSLALGTEAAVEAFTLRAIVDISGGLVPPWSQWATASFPATLIVHGTADSIVPVAQGQALAATLRRLGVAHEEHLLPGENHWFTPEALDRILASIQRFLAFHLIA